MSAPTIRHIGIRDDVRFGERVLVYEPVNLYGCEIGDDVVVGPFVEIQAGARIGPRTRVQSHAFICDGVSVGADCFISHGVMFINDTFARGGPAKRDRALWRPTTVGENVSIGTGAVILPVNICSRAVIGAGAVVTKDIPVPGYYVGNPARLLRPIPSVPVEVEK